MKRQIRQGVFETNSSSQHSITILKNDEYYTQDEINESFYLYNNPETGKYEWDLYKDEIVFGRHPFRTLSSFKDKWCYTYAALVNEYNNEMHKELVSILRKHLSKLDVVNFPTDRNTIPIKGHELARDTDFWRAYEKTEEEFLKIIDEKEKKFEYKINYYENSRGEFEYEEPFTGYCEDYGMLKRFLEEKKISIEEFLTNKKYIIIQDGDEYGYWTDIKESGLINMDVIEYEYE